METPRTGRTPVNETPGSAPPAVSIVIPAYNEALRIGPSLDRIMAFIDGHRLESEVILVDDGSGDGTAETAATQGDARLRVLSNATNRGKGYSVRRGVLEAGGEWVLVTDADLSAPIEEMDRLLDAAGGGADIAIGSRAIDRSKILIHQPRTREWGGMVYNRAARTILGLGIKDTQCGFKLFNREKTEPIFSAQIIEGFGFDPEILFLARQCGLRTVEVPVAWSHDEGTKVRFLADGLGMFADLLRIRWRWITGRYSKLLPAG